MWEKNLTPYASLLVLQTVCHTILMTLLRRMWCQLDQPITPPIDSPLYSYHLRARSCIDIVMRNSVLVTHGHSYVKPNTLKVSFSWYSRMFFICMEKAKGTSTFYPKTMKWDKDTHYTQIKLLPAKTLILLFATTNLHTKIAYFTMGHRASGTKKTAH